MSKPALFYRIDDFHFAQVHFLHMKNCNSKSNWLMTKSTKFHVYSAGCFHCYAFFHRIYLIFSIHQSLNSWEDKKIGVFNEFMTNKNWRLRIKSMTNKVAIESLYRIYFAWMISAQNSLIICEHNNEFIFRQASFDVVQNIQQIEWNHKTHRGSKNNTKLTCHCTYSI